MDFGLVSLNDIRLIMFNSGFSLFRVASGVLLAAVVGIMLGLLRSTMPRRLKRNLVLNFLLEAPKFPPPIAWIPFVILLFGIGEKAAIVIVFIGAFSPIFTAAYEAAESIPDVKIMTARSLKPGKLKYFFGIILPASCPRIITGFRTGLSMGWMSVIAAEMVAGQSGLGYAIQIDRLNLRHELMILDMLAIGLIGFGLREVSLFLEKRIVPWQ